MESKPKRRWFRFAFSLRTLFIVVTLLAVGISIAPTALTVYRRETLAKSIEKRGGHLVMSSDYSAESQAPASKPLPALRRLMGDKPVVDVSMYVHATGDEIDEVRLLFPEATITRLYLYVPVPTYPYYSRRSPPGYVPPKRDPP